MFEADAQPSARSFAVEGQRRGDNQGRRGARHQGRLTRAALPKSDEEVGFVRPFLNSNHYICGIGAIDEPGSFAGFGSTGTTTGELVAVSIAGTDVVAVVASITAGAVRAGGSGLLLPINDVFPNRAS